MRKIFTLITIILLAISSFAQSPEKMSYQAVIRNSTDNLVMETEIGMQISILHNSESGTPVYVETQNPTTNANGLVAIEIGTGTTSDDFSSIDWSDGIYFIKTETDIDGGISYTITGTSQLLSVPYALYAKTAESVTGTITESDPIYTASIVSGITEVDTANWNENQTLSISSNQLSISNGNSVTLPDGMTNVPIYTTVEISSLTPEKGQAVYNSTENLYQIYTGSYWASTPATTCWPQPTIAYAGDDQNIINGNTTVNLTANLPEISHGVGEWSIISGDGGSFSNVSDPNASFLGIVHNNYTLRWTISTSCNQSIDDILVTFSDDGTGDPVTDIDGNTYNTVWIGSQLWMAENLKVTKYADGTAIPLVTVNSVWVNLDDNNTDKAYCYDNNDPNSVYGALYTWAAVMNGASGVNENPSGVQGACPDGWHVSSNAEWDELINYLGGRSEGGKLKEIGTVHWNSPNEGATNESGFTALPGGMKDWTDGVSQYQENQGYWWTTLDDNATKALIRSLSASSYWLNAGDFAWKSMGLSVRCVKD